VRELVNKKVVGPLDGFVSVKTRSRFAASLRLVKDAETGKWKASLDFGDKADLGALTPFWTDPRTGAELCEAGNNFILRERNRRRVETDVPGGAHHVSETTDPRIRHAAG